MSVAYGGGRSQVEMPRKKEESPAFIKLQHLSTLKFKKTEDENVQVPMRFKPTTRCQASYPLNYKDPFTSKIFNTIWARSLKSENIANFFTNIVNVRTNLYKIISISLNILWKYIADKVKMFAEYMYCEPTDCIIAISLPRNPKQLSCYQTPVEIYSCRQF